MNVNELMEYLKQNRRALKNREDFYSIAKIMYEVSKLGFNCSEAKAAQIADYLTHYEQKNIEGK
jgi:hypothetical protein